MKVKCIWSTWHRFTKGLTNTKTFCRKTSDYMDEERLVDIAYLVVSKAFDTMFNSFPIWKLRKHRPHFGNMNYWMD